MKPKILFYFALCLLACNSQESKMVDSSVEKYIDKIKTERYNVLLGNQDSTIFTGYIEEYYDSLENQVKSVFFSTDNSIMMQFVNYYEKGNKVRVDWINGSETLVQYVKNTFDETGNLIRSETYSPEKEFQYGFESMWKSDGKIEEKGPIEEGKPFKPNAIYTYNENGDFLNLKEYDANDSLYATVKWQYLQKDDEDNWLERHMITNDTLNRIEKRQISYRKE